MPTRYALGVDIGGAKTAAAMVGDDGSVNHRLTRPTPATEGATVILDQVTQMCQALISQAKHLGWSITAIGVGAAGQVDSERGVITFAAKTLLGWLGAPVAVTLHTALGLPVVVENDVNALALGEMTFGAGRSFAEAVYVAVGTGVGGAVVRDRRLWRGVT
jgi:glucokinase